MRPQRGRGAVVGRHPDGTLEVWLKAAPEGGRANRELIALLARALKVNRRALEVIQGRTGRRKLVRIPAAAAGRLAALLEEVPAL